MSGRSSDLIKTSTGRRIAPAGIEAKLREIPYVNQAVVVCVERPYLIGIITLDWTQFSPDGLRGTMMSEPSASSEPSIGELSASAMERLTADLQAALRSLPRYEQPAGILVLQRHFSIEASELTTTLKLRREAITQHEQPAIDALHEQIDQHYGEAASANDGTPLVVVSNT